MRILYAAYGARKASVCKEITKLHEGVERITLGEELAEETPKGEYVVVVEGAADEKNSFDDMTVEEHIKKYIDEGMSKMDAVKAVARDRKVPKSEIYKISLDL